MDEVAFTKVPGLPGLELKSVYGSTRLWTRFNLSYAFCAILDANSRWRYRRETHEATAGTVVLMEPGESHVTVEARRSATFRTLLSPRRMVSPLSSSLPSRELQPLQRTSVLGRFNMSRRLRHRVSPPDPVFPMA
jgi:hypothetical protein